MGSRLPRVLCSCGCSPKGGVAVLKTIRMLLPLLAVAALGLGSARGQNGSAPTPNQSVQSSVQPPQPAPDVLATVNGAPIREADVRLAMTRTGHNREMPPEQIGDVLEGVIRQELIYQKAIELGLDADPAYQAEMRRIEAQANAFKRRAMSDLFRRDLARRAEITEEEARRYFTENAARLRTELHVWQILRRNEGSIEHILKEIRRGAPFEEVAKRQFPNLPETAGEPWDLGYLRWTQVPESWQNVVYGLKKGEVSGVIRGPNNRFWIIKLIEKRENPEIAFEDMRPSIMARLKNARIEELCEKVDQDLRASANIVYVKGTPRAEDATDVRRHGLQPESPSE